MKLNDLSPRRLQGGGFSFRCPVCKQQRLVAACPWKIIGDDFATITVQPSLNANPAHGHFEITAGEIVMSNDCKAECRNGLEEAP